MICISDTTNKDKKTDENPNKTYYVISLTLMSREENEHSLVYSCSAVAVYIY